MNTFELFRYIRPVVDLEPATLRWSEHLTRVDSVVYPSYGVASRRRISIGQLVVDLLGTSFLATALVLSDTFKLHAKYCRRFRAFLTCLACLFEAKIRRHLFLKAETLVFGGNS